MEINSEELFKEINNFCKACGIEIIEELNGDIPMSVRLWTGNEKNVSPDFYLFMYVDLNINKLETNYALTHPNRYVRNCRKWFLQNEVPYDYKEIMKAKKNGNRSRKSFS